MRFLGIGDYNSLADMHWCMAQAGHEVRVHVAQPEAKDIFSGLLMQTSHWRNELDWIREAADDGIVVFESADRGELQDQLRADGFNVIGGSAFGDRLENDRAFGQDFLRSVGLRTAATYQFDSYAAALCFLEANPGRYVFKLNGSHTASTRNYIGMLDDGADLRALLEREREQRGKQPISFVLMQHLQGVEVGIGAYFNGTAFLSPALLDWEHKRLFPGDLGELTGEMGTLLTYRGAETLFDQSLARCADALRASGYCGYINLNTIVNEDGLWPLEFTCRFGYPGFAICDALHAEGWPSIFRKMTRRDSLQIETHPGFAVGVVGTVPPFPYEYGYEQLSKGTPIFLPADLTPSERANLHFGEVALRGAQLVCAGSVGYIVVATGRGADAHAAQRSAYQLIDKLAVSRLRYRTDIADQFLRRDDIDLRRWGWLRD